ATPELREQLDYVIYLDAPRDLRLERRVKRDVLDRGRNEEDVRHNFERVVAPMHDLFVEPHRDAADLVVQVDEDRQVLVRGLVERAPRPV
ncbi:MAG: uridine kinase, partial [Acidimicrobiales bacterium]|nr:uridine kinase [Acidimicrobiales bacterium]